MIAKKSLAMLRIAALSPVADQVRNDKSKGLVKKDETMLNDTTFYTADKVWAKILSELGATPSPKEFADITVMPAVKLNSAELKSFFINQIESSNRAIIQKVFGHDEKLSPAQALIIVLLHRTGGATADDLKKILGYSAQSDTHAIDTMIYGLRKTYGRDFIKYNNGKYGL